MRFFWLPLSIMKCSGVPFTQICEWKRRSRSSGSSGSPGWSLVVAMVVLGYASMICLPLSGSDSESEPTSNLQAFTSTTNDYFERQSTMLFQGILWKSQHFSVSFFVFSVSFFACGLDWFFWGCSSLLYPFFCGLGPLFPGFFYDGFPGPNFRVFCLIFCSILMAYR